MTGLATVEAAFLCQDHPIIQAKRVDHSGAHTARSGCPDNDHAIAAKQGEIGGEVRPKETRRLLLLDHDIPKSGRNHRDDFVAVDALVDGTTRLLATRALPPPAAGIPIIRAS